MTTDVIVTWPTNCDYPLWRKYIEKNIHHFNNIIISFSETNQGVNYVDFVIEQMTPLGALFVTNPTTRGDWRNNAVNNALTHSLNAERVWFTEQDYYPREHFWDEVNKMTEPVIATYQQTRLHPCSIFMTRDILERIPRDFSANPPEYDHFGAIQKWLTKNNIPVGKISPHNYFHYNGLSHNWRLLTDGQMPNYQPNLFFNWLRQSLECGVKLHPQWESTARQALKMYA